MHTTLQHGINSAKGLSPNIAHPAQIEGLWEEMEPFIQRSVEHSPVGMLTVDSIRQLLLEDHAAVMYTTRDERIVALLVVRKVHYASYCSVRIIACAGRELKEASRFIDVLSAWCLTMGCVELEAWCRPAMVRLLRHFGFRTKITVVSLDLRGKLQ